MFVKIHVIFGLLEKHRVQKIRYIKIIGLRRLFRRIQGFSRRPVLSIGVMMQEKFVVYFVFFMVLFCKGVLAESAKYSELQYDTLVAGAGFKEIISFELTVPEAGFVFVNSDGRVYPVSFGAATNIWVDIDGENVTNNAIIDYRGTNHQPGAQGSFNLVGGKYVSAGVHSVKLYAQALAGEYKVGFMTNLSAMVKSKQSVTVTSLGSDTGVFAFNTYKLAQENQDVGEPSEADGNKGEVPHSPILNQRIVLSQGEKAIALGAGRIYINGHMGDAMLGIYLNGRYMGNGKSQWAVTDMAPAAELQNTVSVQSYFDGLSAGGYSFSMDASEYPWGNLNGKWVENSVSYSVGSNAKLVVLKDKFWVSGSWSFDSTVNNWRHMRLIATTNPLYPWPKPNTWNMMARKYINVPVGHSGIIMFLVKTRLGCAESGVVNGSVVQQDASENYVRIRVDNVERGSLGVQSFYPPDATISTRTVSASYMTASQPLKPGVHSVEVFTYVKAAVGANIFGCGMSPDLSLVYFD